MVVMVLWWLQSRAEVRAIFLVTLERTHPSHCRLLFCQHYFALQKIILPEWFDLRRRKTEWKKETMKRNKVTEEDKRRNKQRTQIKTSAENTTERPPERPPEWPLNYELSNARPRAIIDRNMKCGTATAPLLHPEPPNKENERPSHPTEVCKRNDQRDVSPM